MQKRIPMHPLVPTLLLAALLTSLALPTQAQTTYRWVDKEGRVHYTDNPPQPTEAQRVERKQIDSGKVDDYSAGTLALRKAMQDFPLTLYTTPNCKDACQYGRDFLAQRGVSYTEKVIQSREDIETFKKITGVENPAVPALQAGFAGKIEKGFEENAWRSLLDASGYPPPAPKIGPAPSRPSSSNRSPPV